MKTRAARERLEDPHAGGTTTRNDPREVSQNLYQLRADLVAQLESLLPGDLNGDGVVDVSDLLVLADAWGTDSNSPLYNPVADLSGDGIINDADLQIFAECWDP